MVPSFIGLHGNFLHENFTKWLKTFFILVFFFNFFRIRKKSAAGCTSLGNGQRWKLYGSQGPEIRKFMKGPYLFWYKDIRLSRRWWYFFSNIFLYMDVSWIIAFILYVYFFGNTHMFIPPKIYENKIPVVGFASLQAIRRSWTPPTLLRSPKRPLECFREIGCHLGWDSALWLRQNDIRYKGGGCVWTYGCHSKKIGSTPPENLA